MIRDLGMGWGQFCISFIFSQFSQEFGTLYKQYRKMKQNQANKVHSGHGFGSFFLHNIYTPICDPKLYFSKNAIFWKRSSIRIQLHKSMAPSANRFQHHVKLRSICIYLIVVITTFFEVNVYVDNYLQYFPSKKCIISLKMAQDSPRR